MAAGMQTRLAQASQRCDLFLCCSECGAQLCHRLFALLLAQLCCTQLVRLVCNFGLTFAAVGGEKKRAHQLFTALLSLLLAFLHLIGKPTHHARHCVAKAAQDGDGWNWAAAAFVFDLLHLVIELLLASTQLLNRLLLREPANHPISEGRNTTKGKSAETWISLNMAKTHGKDTWQRHMARTHANFFLVQ